MGIMNVFENLAVAFGRYVKADVKFKSLDRNDIGQLLKNNIDTHEKIAYALGMMSDKEMKDWMQTKVLPNLKVCSAKAKSIYPDYVKSLIGKAKSEEAKRPLGSLLEANQQYAKILSEINKNLDKLVEEKVITVWNVRMSHIAVLGILRQSDTVANFSGYLFTFLMRVASQSTSSIPRYREEYMFDFRNNVAKAVYELLDKKGAYMFLKDIDSMRREQNDLVLGATGDLTGIAKIAQVRKFSINILDALASALSAINVFAIALDAWDSYKLSKYEKNKETKEWLEAHVALLRMDLADMDRTSPEYTRMVAIIQAYDEKITEYDQEIIEFENGE